MLSHQDMQDKHHKFAVYTATSSVDDEYDVSAQGVGSVQQ